MSSARRVDAEEEGSGELLEKLSDTIARGGPVRMRTSTKILLFALLALFFLYVVRSCMSAFE